MWLTLLLSTALASDPGFYDEDTLSARSEAFRRAGAMAETFRDAQSKTAAVAAALEEYRLAQELIYGGEPSADRERLEDLERTFARDRAVLQHFVDDMIGDFDSAFRAAMDRALAARPGEAVRCEGRIAVGRRLPGMPVRTESNPECTGVDINGEIAAAMDRDAALDLAIDEILARPWPALTHEPEPQPAIGAGDTAVPVAPFARLAIGGFLRDLERVDEEARMPVEAELELLLDGEPTEQQLAPLRTRVQAIESQIANTRGAAFLPIRQAAERVIGDDATWCVNPEYLGGCTVALMGGDAMRRIATHRKVDKVARRL